MAFPNIADIFRQDRIMGALPGGGASPQGSELILSVRGTFYSLSIADNTSPGMYAIDELTRFVQAVDPNDPAGETLAGTVVPPVLITGIDFNQMDITSEMPCLNNVKVFYTFGQNFGQVQIMGEVLLGPLGETAQHNRGFRLIRDFFWAHRVSVTRRPIAVSVANESYFVYLKGMKVGQIDPNYHVMPFMFFGTLLDISREDASHINPRSTVITSGDITSSSLISAIQASQPEQLVLTETFTDIPANPNAKENPFDVTTGQKTGASPVADGNKSIDNAGMITDAKAAIVKAMAEGQPVTPEMVQLKNVQAAKVYLDDQVKKGAFVVDDATVQDEKKRLSADETALSERIVRQQNGTATADQKELPPQLQEDIAHYGLDPITADTVPGVYRPPSNSTFDQSAFGKALKSSIAQTPAQQKAANDAARKVEIQNMPMVPWGGY